jgi:hypothetical protein
MVVAHNAAAQSPDLATDSLPTDSIAVLQSLLDEHRADRDRMERIVDALNVVDSIYKLNYPTWTVLDPDLRERIYRAFRMRGLNVSRNDEVVVTANPGAKEILEIMVGDERMGRLDTPTQLSDSLFHEILTGDYLRGGANPSSQSPRNGKLYGDQPEVASASVSLFGAGFLFANMWGVEGVFGHEELGYHFWSTGSIRVMAVFDRLKLGIEFPVEYGSTASGPLEPLDIRPRRLAGGTGFSGSYHVPAGGGSFGMNLTVSDLASISNFDLLTDSSGSYFLHGIGQLFYDYPFVFADGSQILTVSAGLGYHQVAFGAVQADRSIQTTSKEDFVSPILRVEFQNRTSHMYGASLQYYSSIIHIKGWVEIVKNFVFIDLQYYTPFIRDTKPWEQSYMFMISPRIQLVY